MKTLTFVRLILWSLVLSASLVLLMSQLLLSRTVLDARNMQSLVADTSIYDTVRSDVLVPHIHASVQNSEYAGIVTQETVTSAVDRTFDDAALDALFAPTIESFVNWLSSNQSDLSLPVDAQAEVNTLTHTLAEHIAAQVVAIPMCTWLNTAEDVAQYACRPPSIDDTAIIRNLEQVVQNDNQLQEGQLDILSLMLPASTKKIIEPVPNYVNILYAAAIFAAGVLLLGALRLLIRYRFVGVVALGVSAAVATTMFGVLVLYVRGLPAHIALESPYQKIIQSATALITQDALQIIIIGAITSALLLAIGGGGWLYLRSLRAKHPDTVHLHEHQPIDE